MHNNFNIKHYMIFVLFLSLVFTSFYRRPSRVQGPPVVTMTLDEQHRNVLLADISNYEYIKKKYYKGNNADCDRKISALKESLRRLDSFKRTSKGGPGRP